jgi:multiple antibiotic resistance protein
MARSKAGDAMPPRSCRPVRKIRAFIDRRTALSYLDAMPLDFLISALVTLFVVVDPIGLAPTFLAVTEGLSEKHRRQVALRASIIAAAILVGAAVGGDWLLRQLGISLPAFRIAGGLLLFAIAFEMVFALRQARESRAAEKAAEEHVHHIAAFPLAIPLLAGPGAITAVILLTGQAAGRLSWLAILFGVIAAVTLAAFAAFCAAGRIGRWLGITGNAVASRLLGVILAALAVQYVVDGVRAAFGF